MLSENISLRISVLRNVAIFFVLYIHVYGYFSQGDFVFGYVFDFVSQVVARSSVPVFFFVSGYLLEHSLGRARRGQYGRLIRLAKVYVVWNFIAAFLYFIVSFWVQPGEQSNVSQMTAVEFLQALLGIGRNPINYPLWFLRDLVIVSLVYLLFLRRTSSIFLIVMFLASLMGWFCYSAEGLLQLSSQGPCFFLMGVLLFKFGRFSLLSAPCARWTCLGGYLVMAFVSTLLISEYGWLVFGVFNKVVIFLGVLLFLSVPFERLASFFGGKEYSLLLFVAHEPAMTFLMNWLGLVVGYQSWQFFLVPVFFAVGILGVIILLRLNVFSRVRSVVL
ncbi:acyltransferase [Pontibacterium granulatum]|uniref:acyltransferase family protein n=1 Tax=Pontibacterium granulatum TaxID=2036029 RepID=UPI00249A6454|nr:acyltransferase [Pontibacterium granulatum]MDI3325964.1 acyltransferase [Pontibacterium granulatum]